MPFIKTKVSCHISKEQEIALKSRMGKAIGMVPGKSEAYLLLEFEDNSRLWLCGDDSAPTAYIEAAIFGNESHAGYREFTSEVTKMFQEILDIAPENCYIRFEDIMAWGVSGQYIDRRMFG